MGITGAQRYNRTDRFRQFLVNSGHPDPDVGRWQTLKAAEVHDLGNKWNRRNPLIWQSVPDVWLWWQVKCLTITDRPYSYDASWVLMMQHVLNTHDSS